MPKSLIYNYKTMDQSMAELRKKTQELEAIIGDKDPERVSRASWKNVQDDSIYEKSIQKNQNVNFSSMIKTNLFVEWRIIFKILINARMRRKG